MALNQHNLSRLNPNLHTDKDIENLNLKMRRISFAFISYELSRVMRKPVYAESKTKINCAATTLISVFFFFIVIVVHVSILPQY